MENMTAEQYRKYLAEGRKIADEENVLRGAIANASGRAFESDIIRGCIYYRDSGQAVINKVGEPYTVMRKNTDGTFRGRFIGKAEPDFKGVLRGGRAVAFEAKSTRKTRIQQSAVTPTQGSWLDEQFRMGAITFVCVLIGDRFFSVPWPIWRDMKLIYKKKYLMPADIEEFEVVYDGGVKFLDYVSGPSLAAIVK